MGPFGSNLQIFDSLHRRASICGERMQVNLPRDLRRRMTEQRLHGAERCSHRIEQGRIGMPEPVPAHARQPQPLAGWPQLLMTEVVTFESCTGASAEDQAFGIHAQGLPSCENLDGLCS